MATSAPLPGQAPVGDGAGAAQAAEMDANGQPFVTSDDRFHRVVTPQMQPVLAQMLPANDSTFLPKGVSVRDVALQHERIEVTLEVQGRGEVRYELKARFMPASGAESQKFTVRRLPDQVGDVPGLLAALNARLRATEAAFRWQEVRANTTYHRKKPELSGGLDQADMMLGVGEERQADLKVMGLLMRHRPHEIEPIQIWQVATKLLQTGRDSVAQEWMKELVARFEKARLSGPVPVAVWRRYAGALEALGKREEAAAAVSECARRKSEAPWRCGQRQRAEVARLTAALPRASELLAEVIGDGQGRPLDLLLDQVALLRSLGQTREALALARRSVELHPDDEAARIAVATAETAAGDPAGGLTLWIALAQGPKPPQAAVQGIGEAVAALRATALERDDAELWQRWQAEISASPKAQSPGARLALALAAYHEARFNDAVKALEAVAPALGPNGRVPMMVALAHHYAGQAAQARDRAAEAVKADPSDAGVWCTQARVLQRTDAKAAADAQRRCINLSKRPGASPSALKTLQDDLAAIEAGRDISMSGRPYRDRMLFGPDGSPRPALLVLVGIGLLLAVGGLWWLRRRGGRTEPHR